MVLEESNKKREHFEKLLERIESFSQLSAARLQSIEIPNLRVIKGKQFNYLICQASIKGKQLISFRRDFSFEELVGFHWKTSKRAKESKT